MIDPVMRRIPSRARESAHVSNKEGWVESVTKSEDPNEGSPAPRITRSPRSVPSDKIRPIVSRSVVYRKVGPSRARASAAVKSLKFEAGNRLFESFKRNRYSPVSMDCTATPPDRIRKVRIVKDASKIARKLGFRATIRRKSRSGKNRIVLCAQGSRHRDKNP